MNMPGVMAYGTSADDGLAHVQALFGLGDVLILSSVGG
jgi:hypothetical protein